MANKLKREQKIELGKLLAAGHRRFGLVAPRRPYREDEEGGGGGAGLLLDHPLFMQQPVGAPSDLAMIVNENNHSIEKAEERSEDLNPQLRKALEQKLGLELGYKPPVVPEAKML
jgi:hypothetical protein